MMMMSVVVRELIAAGLSGDALVAAIERIEQSVVPVKSAGATRTQRWRDRNNVSQSVTKRHSDTPPSPLVPPLPPAPLSPPIIPPTLSADGAAPPQNPDEFEKLDTALRKIPGIDRHPVFADPVIAPIWQLACSGIDIKTVIVPAIKARVQKSKPGSIRAWGYFVQGILETAKISAPPEVQVTPDAWSKRLATARKSRQWDANWGVMPGQEGCLVPRELMLDGDGHGWQIWRKAA